jgi:hypothetical protein
VIADRGLLKGKNRGRGCSQSGSECGPRSTVRRDNGATYDEFLTDLAQQSEIEPPTRQDLARIDRTRKKKTSDKEKNG